MQAISSTPPDAPSRWPTMLLVLLIATRRAASPSAVLIARVSASSPNGVLVPWALMYCTSPGFRPASRRANCIGGRRTRGRNGMARPLQVVLDGDDAGGGIAHHLGDDVGVYFARAAGQVFFLALFELVESADAGADDRAAPLGVFLGEFEATVE